VSEVESVTREVPAEIRNEQSNLNRNGLIALYTGLRDTALRYFEKEYQLLIDAEERISRPIHKGRRRSGSIGILFQYIRVVILLPMKGMLSHPPLPSEGKLST